MSLLRTIVPVIGWLTLFLSSADAQSLELRKGDHLSIIGNTLADRMQHTGWLEAYLNNRFPKHELVVRNLGFSGDEVEVSKRLRSQGFGSPDQHLTVNKSDVVFAFFGYNESYGDEAGLPKFKSDLDKLLKDLKGKQFNGKSAPRVALFSPIAFEDLKSRNLPDGKETNRRLSLYTAAMYEVAKNNNVAFVDLFRATQGLYEKNAEPLTINGVHLNDLGDQQVAQAIDEALFGARTAPVTPASLEKLRQAIKDKNFHWYAKYRTTDGYSIFGGRADLKFVAGQTNRDVAQREMQILDVMTQNRDKRIWSVAQGGDLKVDDSNTPDFIPVTTNKKGGGPNGEHIFLSGIDAIGKMTLGKDLKINLFATEEKFPELAKPVQMAFDVKGRLWVAAWPSYPHWKPKDEMNDKLLIFEDTDGDGVADKCKVFADKLQNPTGFQFYNGGVLVAHAPELLFLKDTNGDDVADVRQPVLHGLDSADTHHTSNSFSIDPGGAFYFQEGTFHHTQVETAYGPPARSANAAVFRYEPRAQKFDVFVAYGFANPHGNIWDRWGQNFVTDGTGAQSYFSTAFSGRLDYPKKHPHLESYFKQRTRPCPGTEILSSRHFPDDWQGNLLIGNVINVQGILRYKYEDNGSGFGAKEMEPVVLSSDPNFRPSALEMGPDGAIYFTDWQNPIIGHMQHNLRDPSRDKIHGRVYRITHEGRPLLKPAKIAGEPIEKLLDLLKEPEDRVRQKAKIELGARDTDQVIAAVGKWARGLDSGDPEFEHHRLEALWVHQYHNVVNEPLLREVLASPDFRARAAATRVLCYQRDRVKDALGLLKTLAADQHPRVRLEAVRAASFFTEPEAVEVVLVSNELPGDYYLNYTRAETMKQLDPYWKSAVEAGRKIEVTTEAGARFFLKNIKTEQLLSMPKTKAVALELLLRPGLRDEQRRAGLRELAKLESKTELRVLLDSLVRLDAKQDDRDETVVLDLVRQLNGRNGAELAQVRGDLEGLATGAKSALMRQIGYLSLIAVDGNADSAWTLAVRKVGSLVDLLAAVPLISDSGVRASLYAKIEPLLKELPPSLSASAAGADKAGHYVRIELPGRGKTLTLAEVEVYSGGQNVARKGKASQSSVGSGGEAGRAIDGNTSPIYLNGGQTHTAESSTNPWWEVNLGKEFSIESIVVFNRGDGALAKRLDGYSVVVLDAKRKEVFRKDQNPAPDLKSKIEIDAAGKSVKDVRSAAMNALASVRGQEAKTFKSLAAFVTGGKDQILAVRALRKIPAVNWPKEDAPALVKVAIETLKNTPAAERTSDDALDVMNFAEQLASLLPADQGAKTRAELGEIGVRVIRLGTLPERMAFDQDVLIVKAGKPVEFILDNADLMPHNFVIVKAGSLQEVGEEAEKFGQQSNAADLQFVPPSKKAQILLSSKILQTRETQRLSFVAPTQPGVYPYVCTYPGHWRRMFGALYVVEDLDACYSNPEVYLAAVKLPIKDELLKDRRPRTEWKFDELAELVGKTTGGRSYSHGKQLFKVASCVSCHKLDGEGNEFGADLLKLDPKLTSTEILKDMLEPSHKINEKYQSFVFQLESGQVKTGLIVGETPTEFKIMENPLASPQPTILKKANVTGQKKSPISLMPKGLLDKLSREEILDLVAFITCRGDKNHELFKGDSHEHK